MVEPGDTIQAESGETLVVVDVVDYRHETGDPDDVWAVLRYPDGDSRRDLDEDGGDDLSVIAAVQVGTLTAVGHI